MFLSIGKVSEALGKVDISKCTMAKLVLKLVDTRDLLLLDHIAFNSPGPPFISLGFIKYEHHSGLGSLAVFIIPTTTASVMNLY
jgi:hypothetical protein